ncbi:MAG: 30S ribosomal protein S8 [Holosporales bacterium]|jgi:small subunit ribosomal protein S8|nr:30S ribosomal protein S8 [Holosporales bacterium]
MSVVDSISDLITRIRNAQMARKSTVDAPMSKGREALLKVLLDEGYIRGYTIVDCPETGFKKLCVELKYFEGKPVICEIKRVSKPGRRVYSSIKDLQFVKNGLGINILSTDRGIMSDVEARKLHLGGEIVCSVF